MAVAAGVLIVLGSGGYFVWQLLAPPAAGEVRASRVTADTGAAVPTTTASITTANALLPGAADPPLNSAANAPADLTFIQAVGMAPTTLNPVYASDAAAQSIINKLYPRLLGQDPHSGFIVASELAEHWEISPDGRTYTFILREGVRWSDGAPVVANDFKFTYDALASPLVQSPYRDRTVGMIKVDAPDPRTVVVTLAGPNCAVLHSLRQPLLPSHHFAPDFSDLATNALNQAPTVSAGPFIFVEHVPGEHITLARNPDYWQGAPQIATWQIRIIADPNARRGALADGMIDLAYFDVDEVLATSLDIGSTVVVNTLPTDGYSFLALNLADPANPQPGRAGDGTSLPQSPHPILGELAVRQAIAAAVDYERIIAEVYHGRATRTASYVPATVSWAYAGDLALPAYDPERAAQLLTEAGWELRDENGAGAGLRTRGDQPLRLSIRTNEDNPQRVEIAHLLAEQLRALGVDVQLEVVSFNDLTATLLDQRFDLVVIGWENLGADPGNSPFWHSQADIPGAGFNFTSFHDEEVDSWLESATRLPGCDFDSRRALYTQVQQRIAATLPYIPLATQQSAWAYQSRWQEIAPGPWSIDYNVAAWRLPSAP